MELPQLLLRLTKSGSDLLSSNEELFSFAPAVGHLETQYSPHPFFKFFCFKQQLAEVYAGQLLTSSFIISVDAFASNAQPAEVHKLATHLKEQHTEQSSNDRCVILSITSSLWYKYPQFQIHITVCNNIKS